jgi:hypothetical protein
LRFVDDAIDAKAHIALGLHVRKHIYKFALFLTRHRRQNHQPCVLGQRQHRIHHLADSLRLQGLVVVGAVGASQY